MAQQKGRFETFLISLAVFATGAVFAVIAMDVLAPYRRGREHPETTTLRARFGPSKVSANAEEWAIRDFFADQRGGVFVDVGSSDYRENSNTYYLETQLGWSGLAIDPLKAFEADYLKFRPRTKFRSFFVSDRSDSDTTVYVLDNNSLVTSSDKSFTLRHGKNVSELKAPTITLNELLTKEGISKFDFMSMDIELSEPKALAGFDIERFRPRLVCIEAHLEVRQQILDFFARHDYTVVGKYLRADSENLYFMPLEAPQSGAPSKQPGN
jgi:hypothetical protein